jgi:serine/threonine-protein kinase
LQGAILAGRYRLEELLGEGGFGVVYRATQMPLGRAVAVKLMQPSFSDDGARFAQEAALAQRLEHPNTVRILDFGVLPDGRPFIVWELLRGQTVAELLTRSGPLPDAIARHVAAQVLKSLMEAHALGIVHRDIKPANVFVAAHPGEPYFVKVLDFGIAKDLGKKGPADPAARTLAEWSTNASDTRGSQLMGTPRYMAPEQAMGEPVGADTDVYAVGLLLAEMLTGEPVWGGEDGMAILMATASPAPVPLSERVQASPLGTVVERATRKRRHERFATAGAMLAELEAVRGLDDSALSSQALPTPVTGSVPPYPPSGALGFQPTVAVGNFPTIDRTAPPLQYTYGGARSSAPSPTRRRGWLVGLGAVLAVVAVGAGVVGLFQTGVIELGSGTTERKHARARDETEETEESEAPKATETPPKLSKEEWAKRKPLLFEEEALKKKLAKEGYEVTHVTHYGVGTGMDQAVISVTKGQCAGSIITYSFPGQALSDANLKALSDQPYMRVFQSKTRVLAVAMSRLDRPQGDLGCTDLLAIRVTE